MGTLGDVEAVGIDDRTLPVTIPTVTQGISIYRSTDPR